MFVKLSVRHISTWCFSKTSFSTNSSNYNITVPSSFPNCVSTAFYASLHYTFFSISLPTLLCRQFFSDAQYPRQDYPTIPHQVTLMFQSFLNVMYGYHNFNFWFTSTSSTRSPHFSLPDLCCLFMLLNSHYIPFKNDTVKARRVSLITYHPGIVFEFKLFPITSYYV